MTIAAHGDTGVYIEVVIDTYAASKLVMQLHDNLAHHVVGALSSASL